MRLSPAFPSSCRSTRSRADAGETRARGGTAGKFVVFEEYVGQQAVDNHVAKDEIKAVFGAMRTIADVSATPSQLHPGVESWTD